MIPRRISATLLHAAESFPIVTLLGPRQSGKTTLVQALFPDHLYINLENPETRALFASDPKELLLNGSAPVIVDEAQREPEILSWIQVFSDRSRAGLVRSRPLLLCFAFRPFSPTFKNA